MHCWRLCQDIAEPSFLSSCTPGLHVNNKSSSTNSAAGQPVNTTWRGSRQVERGLISAADAIARLGLKSLLLLRRRKTLLRRNLRRTPGRSRHRSLVHRKGIRQSDKTLPVRLEPQRWRQNLRPLRTMHPPKVAKQKRTPHCQHHHLLLLLSRRPGSPSNNSTSHRRRANSPTIWRSYGTRAIGGGRGVWGCWLGG